MSDAKKILVVDDDASLTGLLQDYLPKVLKHKLYVALTGEEALKVLENESPDLLLLDMQLPGIQGTQVLRIIRERYPKTKVLVITSYDKEVKDIVSKLGVDGFFPKPIVLSNVIDRVEEVLKAEEGTRVVPVTLDEVKRKEGIMPVAKILFIEREFCMPYLLPISYGNQYPLPVIEPYGEYEYEAVYCQRDAIPALAKYKPDIVISATDVPEKDSSGSKSVSTAELVADIMKSKNAPKAVIIHGRQRDIDSHGVKDIAGKTGIWLEKEDMYNYDEEKDKENAERLNKMIWSVCFKNGLVKKVG